MAIKIQGTTVIDDSRNATALTELSFDSITLNGTTVVANADELNRLQGVTNPIDSQLGALAKDRGTLNKTFTSGETAAISLTSAFPSDEVPVLSVTKEVPQTGVTSNDWDVASDGANYTLHDTAYDTTLTPSEVGFALENASYTGTSLNVNSEETFPLGVFFKPDGLKMYVVGGSDEVNQYDLSTSWDLSTASYSNKLFSVSSQDTQPAGVFFRDDGLKMYIVGTSSDSAYEYDLSTAWDITTSNYSNVSLDVSSETGNPAGLFFKSNGLEMYIVGIGSSSTHKYNLSSAWDLSSAAFSGDSFDISNEDTAPQSIFFKPDGMEMFIVGSTNDSVYQYSTFAADGSFEEQTAFNDTSTIAAGDWSMFALDVESAAAGLTLTGLIESHRLENVSFQRSKNLNRPTLGLYIREDGLLFFTTDDSLDEVVEYSLSSPYDISTISSASSTFSLGGIQSDPQSIFFKKDGTKMFVCGQGFNSGVPGIDQFSLSQPWDISTSSYDSIQLDVSSKEQNPTAMHFSDDGKRLFIAGYDSDKVISYTLQTAWDLSSASADSGSLDVSAQASEPRSLTFSPDGKKLFIGTITPDRYLFQYDLQEPFNLSTGTYSGNDYLIPTGDSPRPAGLSFNSEGSKLFVADNGVQEKIIELDTYFVNYSPTSTNHTAITTQSIDSEFWTDINSMTADDASNDGSVYYAVSTDDRTTWSIIDDTNGVRNIVRDNGGTWEVNDASDYGTETWVAATENDEFYALEEAVDVSTAQVVEGFAPADQWSYNNVSFDVSAEETTPTEIVFNNDGTKMYVIGRASDSVHQYTLTTAFDISTASYDLVSFSVSAQETNPSSMIFSADGTRMYVTGYDSDSVHQYTLGTAFDVNTASYNSISLNVSSEETQPRGVEFDSSGNKMYIIGTATGSIFQYTLSTAFDLSTASYDNVSFDVGAQDSAPKSFSFNSDGKKMYVLGSLSNTVYEYSLSTPFDISSITYSSLNFSVSSENSSSLSICFNSDGTQIYMSGESPASIFQYTTEEFTSINRMDATQLNAVSDANHYTLGDDLDLAITMFMADGNTSSPTSDGVSINYDANALNQAAIPGTDYNYDFPSSDTVRFTALSPENFKIRVA